MPADITKSISLARNGNFNRLWASQILSQIAQNLLNFALVIRVYQLAQGTRFANISVALLILSFGLPSVLFAAAAGVFVDHWNRRRVLLVVNFLRAILVMGYPLFEHNLWIVLLLSFVISTTTQFFTPAESAAIPTLVSPKQLLRANALFVFTLYASFIVGYSGSAPTIALFGPQGPYLVTAAMFALAGILDFFLPSLPASKSLAKISASRLFHYTMKEINSNWRLIQRNHNLAFPITQLTIGQGVLAVIMALAPAMAVALLGIPIEQSSHYLVVPAGIGLIAGVIAVEHLTKLVGRTRLIILGVMIAALSLMSIGGISRLQEPVAGHTYLGSHEAGLIVAGVVFMLGFVNAMVSVAAQTILQESTTDATRGKTFGALGMLMNISATAPVLFAGVLADLAGVSRVITVIGALLMAYGVLQGMSLYRTGQLSRPPVVEA